MQYQIPWPWSYMIYQNNVETIASSSLFKSLLILPPILSLTFCSMVGPNKMLSFFCPKLSALGNQIKLFVQSIHLPLNIFLVLFVHLLFAHLLDSAAVFALSAGCMSSPNQFLHHFSLKQERHSWPSTKI